MGTHTTAIPYSQNKTERSKLDPLQKGMEMMLTTDLSKVKGLQVLERVKIQTLLEELGLQVPGLVGPHTAPRVGRLSEAR